MTDIDTMAIRELCVQGLAAINRGQLELAKEAFRRIKNEIRNPPEVVEKTMEEFWASIKCKTCMDSKKIHYGGSFGGEVHYRDCPHCT